MAINFSTPTTADNYSSAFVPNIIANQIAIARFLDSVQSGSNTNVPTYAKRYNRTNAFFDEYNGSTWAEMPLGYAKKAGDTFSGAVAFSSTVSITGQMTIGNLSSSGTLQAGSGSNGYAIVTVGDTTHSGLTAFYAANAVRQGYIGFSTSTGSSDTGTINFVMATAAFTGAITATSFAGAGTGLTGTAASLSIGGNAVTAGGLAVGSVGNATANQIVRTDSSGYIQSSYINTTSGDNGTTAITKIYAGSSTDNYIRFYTLANFTDQIRTTASGSWGINVTGSSGSTSQTSWSTLNTTSQLNSQGNQATTIATATGSLGGIMVQGPAGSSAAFMSFYRTGTSAYAAYFGIDTDNKWKVGGWSMGAAAYELLHSGNYTTYAPTLTGGSASGTWGINVTGSAASVSGSTSNGYGTRTVSTSAASGGSDGDIWYQY